jgi:WhiB family redox-sensing transcriptional regulator
MLSQTLTPTWMTQALCSTVDNKAIFFEEQRVSIARTAKKICGECPVKNECFVHAIEHREVGIWGGMTTNERAKYLRAQRRAVVRPER